MKHLYQVFMGSCYFEICLEGTECELRKSKKQEDTHLITLQKTMSNMNKKMFETLQQLHCVVGCPYTLKSQVQILNKNLFGHISFQRLF